jgi:hypothetical protein
MDLQFVQALYQKSTDSNALPEDRNDARNYLSEHEAEIVNAILLLPEMCRYNGKRYESYDSVFYRNCLDAGQKWAADPDGHGGMYSADLTTIPDESDKIGNLLFRFAEDQRARAEDEKKFVTA